jgi:hypothetical protein
MDQKADILKENERLLISLQQLEGIVLAFRSGNVNALVNQPTDSDLSRLRVLEIRYSSSTVRTVDFGSLWAGARFPETVRCATDRIDGGRAWTERMDWNRL